MLRKFLKQNFKRQSPEPDERIDDVQELIAEFRTKENKFLVTIDEGSGAKSLGKVDHIFTIQEKPSIDKIEMIDDTVSVFFNPSVTVEIFRETDLVTITIT